VDDDPFLLQLAARVLRTSGFGVISATTGRDALVALHSDAAGEIGLVFADVHLPGMDGCELAAEVQALHPDVPVVLTSGSGEAMADVPCPSASCFLGKPYTPSALIECVRGTLGARGESASG